MIEAYAIGVNLALTGNLSAVIAQVSKEFGALNTTIKNVQISVNELAASMRGLQRIGVSAASAWKDAAVAMERAAKAASSVANSNIAQPMQATGTTGGGGFGPRALPYVAAGALAFGGGGGRIVGFGAGGGGGGGGNVPFIGGPSGGGGGGIPLSYRAPLTPPSSHELALATAGFGIIGASVYGAEQNMFADAALVGALKSRMKMAGFTDKQVDASMAAARAQAAAIPGLTLADALHTILDVRTMTGSPETGIAAMPEFSKLGLVLGANGRADEYGDLRAAITAGELKGAIVDPKTHEIDADRLTKFVANVRAATIATDFRYGPREILQTLKSGGVSASVLSDQALFADQVLPMLTLGAAGGGTALQGFGMQFGAGKMSEAAGDLLNEMGLLNLEGHSLKDYKVGIGQFDLPPGVLKGRDDAMQNPADFIMHTLVPGIDAYLKNHDTPVTQENRMTAAQQLASRIPGGKYIADFIRLAPIVDRERGQFHAAQGRDSYKLRVENDPTLAVTAFNAAYHNMMAELGTTFMKDAIAAMNAVTQGMQALGKWATEQPDTARHILDVAAALGSLATAIGIISGALFVAGPMIRVLTYGSGVASAVGTGVLRGVAGVGLTGVAGLAAFGAGVFGIDALRRGMSSGSSAVSNSFSDASSKMFGDDAFYNYKPWQRGFWLPSSGIGRGSPGGASGSDQGTPNNPLHVIIENHAQVGASAASGTVRGITNSLAGPRATGPGPDIRVGAFGNAYP